MKLPKPFSKSKGTVNAIIETPGKSRNKFTYEPKKRLFRLSKTLPAGMSFPCPMGFIPGTEGDDGDPLDILVFSDGPLFTGCWVECRLIGVIRAKQADHKKDESGRNDRFIAVPANEKAYDHIKKTADLGRTNLEAIVAFFENYNRLSGKKFSEISIEEASAAMKLIKAGKIG